MPSKAETRLLETNEPLLHTHDRTLSEPTVEVVSGGQERHWETDVALYWGEKVLTGQLVQTEDATAEKVPALHAAHVMSLIAPSAGDAVPEGQLTHAPPVGEENVPVGQMSTRSSSCVMD